MKALTFQGKRRLVYETVPDPEILAPEDAIVGTELMAVCGSDLHPYHERERGLEHGTVMGHEGAGVVLEAGGAVRGLKKGDRVMCPFSTSCGSCFYCRGGLTSRCVLSQLFGWRAAGKGLHGWQAELVRVPLAESTLMKIPEGLSAEKALLLGDTFSTGYFCAELAEVSAEGTYAVLGCGPVGLMAVVAARLKGARRVYAVDGVPRRLALAAEFGALPLDLKESPAERLREATEGRGADAVMEAVGSPAAQRLAFDMLRPGGILAVAGVNCAPGFSFSPNGAYDKNLTYRVGRCPARRYMEELLPGAGSLPIERVFTHRSGLSDGAEAYRIFDEKRDGCVKIALVPR